ncbi:MAG: 2-oxoglutarate and iron-dependent oxygenase domain-containing protein [Polyangiales bacterium]
MTELPTIDVAPLLDVSDYTRPDTRAQVDALRRACTEVGFFYLANYGVAPEEERALFALARQFFALPLADKLRIENVHSPHFRGYTRVGQEHTGGVPDQREQLDVGAEKPVHTPADPLYLRLRGPNQWPAALPALRTALHRWVRTLDRVAVAITRALAVALGQDAHWFDGAFLPDPDSHLKVIRYPAQAASTQGVGAHKDYGFLAFIMQDERGGLEVDDLRGGWLEARPVAGTLVANLGEMFEVATAGYFRATLHRVRAPHNADRISLAHFFSPKLEAVLGELPNAQLLSGGQPRPHDPSNPIHAEFGLNALRGWLRSHPEVARRHYPELNA